MNVKNNKKLILPGILLIVSILCYIPYEICARVSMGISGYDIAWKYVIPVITYTVVLILYCFIFNKKTKLGNYIYFIGFGVFALININACISYIFDGYFDILRYDNILCIAVAVIMIIIKIKPIKGLSIIGMIILGAYALITINITIFYFRYAFSFTYIHSFIMLIYIIKPIIEFIAFFHIWLIEGGNIMFKKNVSTIAR